MIEEDQFYSPPVIPTLHPLFKTRDYNWFLKQIKQGRLKAYNSNPGGVARYLVSGKDLNKFIDSMRVEGSLY